MKRALVHVLAASAALLAACDEKPAPKLGWSIEFVCDSDRNDADALTLEVRKQDCSGEPAYQATIARGETPAQGPAVAPGRYGLFARASREGEVIAEGCVLATLPAAEPPRIALSSDNCRASTEDAGGVEDEDAGSELDATDDADLDAAPSEPGDAAQDDADLDGGGDEPDADELPVCPPDCSDNEACTDDRCVDGVCVHDPFSGLRECDRIACTVGDQCVYGACEPGTATDSACPDDGNPCTDERCVAGAGCNRGPAEGNTCNDHVTCTVEDLCHAGVCRGTDDCGSGVCSAGANQCIAGCTSNTDCDDNDPCTSDNCSGNGVCVRVPSTGAACDDKIGCTINDRCTNGVCAGTSTCPAQASCEGSTCACPSGQSLCAASCVDTSANTSHCGLCDRRCNSGSICQNGACRPPLTTAPNCTARRYGGHDYLFCTDPRNWGDARTRCTSFGFGLAIVDGPTENAFVQANIAGQDTWFGANDAGDDSTDCKLAINGSASGEGHWFWASATTGTQQGTPLCTYSKAAPAGCVTPSGGYQNWNTGEPNNQNCGCALVACTPGQDCGVIKGDGSWDDTDCGGARGYVCESP